MSLTTFSKFYFGHTITSDNKWIDFNEGGPQLYAELDTGNYSLEEFAAEIKRAMDAAGTLTYTVSVNRTTRVITISSTATFALLTTSGDHAASSAYSLAGFSGADKTGTNTYSGSAGSGSSYSPQFILQDHIDAEDWEEAIEGTVHEAGDGSLQVWSLGTKQYIQMRIRFSNNKTQPSSGPIRENASGVANLRTFMRYLRTKGKFEFIPDENTPATFYKVILENSEDHPLGLGYKNRERYDIGMPGYFDTPILKLRVVP